MDHRRRARGDGGQVGLALALLVVAAATGAMLVTATVGRTVIDRTRARTAADAAALAAVAGGPDEARRVAEANGGQLEDLSRDGAAVEARVRVGTARATSRAAPVPPGGTGSPPAWQSARVPPPRGAIAQSVRAHP